MFYQQFKGVKTTILKPYSKMKLRYKNPLSSKVNKKNYVYVPLNRPLDEVKEFFRIVKECTPVHLCINDAPGTSAETKEYMLSFLAKKFPVPSPYELR